MLINTLKAKKRLVEEYGFSERHAEGVVEIVTEADEQVATRQDLELLEQRLYTAMNRRALALFVGLLGAMWGLLELYL